MVITRDLRLIGFVKIVSVYNPLYEITGSSILEAFEKFEAKNTVVDDHRKEMEKMKDFILGLRL